MSHRDVSLYQYHNIRATSIVLLDVITQAGCCISRETLQDKEEFYKTTYNNFSAYLIEVVW